MPVARNYVDPDRSPVMQDQYDAILYLGPPSAVTYSTPSRDLCKDAAYLEMRLRRMRIVGMDVQVEAAKRYCTSIR